MLENLIWEAIIGVLWEGQLPSTWGPWSPLDVMVPIARRRKPPILWGLSLCEALFVGRSGRNSLFPAVVQTI